MITGSCLCGAVAFAVDGRASPIQLCHARRCQKSTGSAFAPELAVRTDAFRWTRGEDQLRVYEAPLLREPPPFRRTFCGHCGSPMPTAREGSAFTIILAGVLDEDPRARPFREILLSQAAPWYEHGELQRFEGRPPPDQRLPDKRKG